MSLPDGIIRERTRQYGVTDDPFVGLPWSFQYAENLNVFDDPRGIKLSTAIRKVVSQETPISYRQSCILVSGGDFFVRIPESWPVMKVTPENRPNGTNIWNISWNLHPYDAVIFENWVYVIQWNVGASIRKFCLDGVTPYVNLVPVDRTWDTVITMWTATPNYCDCITNFNNSMLLVGNGNYLWIYNPAEDIWLIDNKPTWWKIVKKYSAECTIREISPKADYVEVFIEDSAWNTKIHYYPWIFDMEDSGLMKSVELPNTRLQRVYPHMTKEMVVITLDGSNNNVSLREVIGYETYPVMRSHRAWLSPYDVQHKLGFFLWPCSRDMVWYNGRAYIADKEWVRELNWYDEKKMPVCTLRWKIHDQSENHYPTWLAVAKDFIYVSYDDTEYCMRIYDTANPAWYVDQWMLISRAIETEYGWEFTKQLVKWMVQFEMNNLTDENGSIDIYVCGNRERNSPEDEAWVHIAHIDQSDADFSDSGESNNGLTQYNIGTCVHRFDNAGDLSFMQDRQVIEYKVVITRGEERNASPVLRSLLFNYDVKEKTNYF